MLKRLRQIKKILPNFYRQSWHRNILEELLQQHRHLLIGQILDIGSKNQRYSSWFDGQVTAVDIEVNEQQGVIFGDIEKGLPYPDSSFDSILCVEVFEYLDDYEKAITEIKRLLKTHGQAIITIPFMYHVHNDRIRLTEITLREKFAVFSKVSITLMGNGYTVLWDILRKKILLTGNSNWFLKKLVVLIFFCFNILRLHVKPDQYYSGLFIVAVK